MAVDLARNDVGTGADFGTVRVTEMMEIERYSHVMHIASMWLGVCAWLHCVRSGLKRHFQPALVSGAPKIPRHAIISDLGKDQARAVRGRDRVFWLRR